MFFTANSVFSKNLKNISDTISIQDSSKQKINLTRSPQELYATCSQCHTIGKGKLIGPDLLNVDERHNILWISNFINNSDSLIKSGDTTAIKLFNSNEKIPMPKHDFDSTEISNLVNYIIIEGNKLKVNPNFLDNPKSFLPKSNNWLIIIGIFLVLLSVFDIFFTKFLRLKIIHVLLIFIGIGIIGKIVYQEATYLGRSLGYEPDQPIKFSHKQHAGDNKIDCIYCHTGVNNSRYASIPPESICLNCHNVITNGTNTGEEEINKLHQYVDNNEPIKWIKVYNLPDYVNPSTSYIKYFIGFETPDCNGTKANVIVKSNWVQSVVTGINNTESFDFSVFPNPVSDQIEIRTTLNDYELEIQNIFGQVLQKFKNAKEINVGDIAPGTYILKIRGDKLSRQERIIVY